MTGPVRPSFPPTVPPATLRAPANDPRAAFFRQALDRVEGAPPPAPARTAQRVDPAPAAPKAPTAEAAPGRLLRPGSLVDLKV